MKPSKLVFLLIISGSCYVIGELEKHHLLQTLVGNGEKGESQGIKSVVTNSKRTNRLRFVVLLLKNKTKQNIFAYEKANGIGVAKVTRMSFYTYNSFITFTIRSINANTLH